MPPLSPRSRSLVITAAVVCGLWALAIYLTGGGVVSIGGLRVSSRSALRPGIAAFLLGALALARATTAERAAEATRLSVVLDRAAPWLAVMLATTLAAFSALFNEHVAGGSDSSGYLHQSALWSQGRLTLRAPVLDGGAWPSGGWEVAPLGFRPSVTPGELGPAYAPGLPWLMAAAALVAGEPGRFVWTPLAAGLLVWLTFVLTRRLAPPGVALGAAVLVASSPPVVFQATQTMSDLVTAALWTGALAWLTSPAAPRPVLAGLAAGLALVVRPNLVGVAALVGLAAIGVAPAGHATRWRRAVAFGAPLVVAALAIAWLNQRLWGAPWASGYGATGDLFVAASVPDNLRRLWRWTVETRGWWVPAGVAALIAGLVAARHAPPPRRAALWLGAALTVGVVGSYLPYAVFEEWWYLRFYLVAWPVLATTATVAAWQWLTRWSVPIATPAVAVAALLIAGPALRVSAATGVAHLWQDAQRYVAVAEWVRAHATSSDVIWSVQHSGALSAAGVATVARFDLIDPTTLDARVAALSVTGRSSWAVLDDVEEADWRRRFATERLGQLDWAPLAEARRGPSRVRLYDLSDPTRAVAPALIRVIHGGPWPWRRRPAQATK